jgi:hypothetical protein
VRSVVYPTGNSVAISINELSDLKQIYNDAVRHLLNAGEKIARLLIF